jgi:transcriptional regulator with XRE-family HTH domain
MSSDRGTLRKLRTPLGLTQQRLAEIIGVSQQTVARWEAGGTIPTKYLRDLAVVLACDVSDLVAGVRPVLHGARLESQAEDAGSPWGTVRIAFVPPAPKAHAYPIGRDEHGRLWTKFERHDDRAMWFSLETLDDRLVFASRTLLETLEIVASELEPMPPLDRPRYAGITIETVDGRRRHLVSDPPDLAYGEIRLLETHLRSLGDRSDPRIDEWLLEFGGEGSDRSLRYRLGALRLIEAPLGALSRPAARESTADDLLDDLYAPSAGTGPDVG